VQRLERVCQLSANARVYWRAKRGAGRRDVRRILFQPRDLQEKRSCAITAVGQWNTQEVLAKPAQPGWQSLEFARRRLLVFLGVVFCVVRICETETWITSSMTSFTISFTPEGDLHFGWAFRKIFCWDRCRARGRSVRRASAGLDFSERTLPVVPREYSGRWQREEKSILTEHLLPTRTT
jgi:hypothetical protein